MQIVPELTINERLIDDTKERKWGWSLSYE